MSDTGTWSFHCIKLSYFFCFSESSHSSEDELPKIKAWGKKKSLYFGTDYVDKDFRSKYDVSNDGS